MLIASKYEEIWAPEVRDFIYISDKAYTKEQILSMEKLMLNTLKFELSLPTPFNFLLRFLKACGARQDRQVEWLSHYLAELALVDYSMLKYSYSLTSAAAIYVAMKTLNRIEPYPKALARHSHYSEEAVKPCAVALVELMVKAPTATLLAVHKKYSNQKYGEVSKLEPPHWLLDESMEVAQV
jgi:G2/mitotic-specific cyclin-B, other